MKRDEGSTIPLILGFFLLALLVVAASVTLGQVFVQQRDLQDICDGAAAAAAASSADLDRGVSVASGSSLQFDGVQRVVDAYLGRDPARREVDVAVTLSPDHERITLRCSTVNKIAFGAFIGRREVPHTATSTARAAVVG
jgi:Putative Flp pilus-assembly TadE/G-like